MDLRARLLAMFLLASALAACTLPAPASPTPFTFPTPNMTLTAIFAPALTNTPPPPTLPPLDITITSAATLSHTTTPSTATTQSIELTPSVTAGPLDTRPNGSIITASFLSTPPTIDGYLNEWSSPSFSINSVVFGASAWSSKSDLSGKFQIGWDSSNLYLAVQATDDKLVQVSSGISIYKGDEVEIMLDTSLSDDFYVRYLSQDDYQIGLSPGNFGSLPPGNYRFFPRNIRGPQSSIVIKAQTTSSGYNLEAKLPWLVFGLSSPPSGSRFGFALAISDNDQAGVANQQSMVAIISGYRLADPTTWGTLALESPTAN